MTTHSSSTAETTSKVADRVAKAISGTLESQDSSRFERVNKLRERIRDLEERGFINRQSFSAPTTADFERQIFYNKGL